MTLIVDPIESIVEFLKTDSDLLALVTHNGTVSIYGVELDESETDNMPRQALVIQPAGGGGIGTMYQPVSDVLVNALCYGATFYEAGQVRRAVHAALKQMTANLTSNNALLRWAKPVGGPVSFRDPEGEWPVQMETFQVMASENAAA